MALSDVVTIFNFRLEFYRGFTILREFDANGVQTYEGYAAGINADPAASIWVIVKLSVSADSKELAIKDQYSTTNQKWTQRATLFP